MYQIHYGPPSVGCADMQISVLRLEQYHQTFKASANNGHIRANLKQRYNSSSCAL